MSKSPQLPFQAHLSDGAPAPQLAPEPSFSAGRVLIVDDVAANVRLLAGILKVEGFEVEGASSGAEALEMLAENTPDVVLLDVMMPGMDGLEVCERIRHEPATAQLPVVMVTALQGINDRVRALEAGADDFLSKPVDEVEVVARVRSLVRAKRNRDALERAYRDLQVAERARENLASMLVHDLRTPLTTMLASLGYLQSTLTPSGNSADSPAASTCNSSTPPALDDTLVQMLAICARSGQHLLSLVNQLLDIARLESHEMPLHIEDVDPQAMAEEAIDQVCAQAHYDRTRITISVDEATPSLRADPDLLRRVLINLLGNAIKFTRRGSEVRVQISASTEPERENLVLFEVSDEGQGVAPDDQERIFDKFAQAQSRREGKRSSSGLGLFFCKLAVEAHGGRIGVHSQPGQGSTFYFVLPSRPSLPDS